MINGISSPRRQSPPRGQRGAVLFVALVFLILLTLLGLAAAQTSTLEERMAGNYLAHYRAFENAERRISRGQAEIQDASRAADTIPADPVGVGRDGKLPWDPWLTQEPQTGELQTRVRYCVACPQRRGGVFGEDPARKPRFYILSGVDGDDSRDSVAIVQTVYVF